ncbi:helix-turn-helix transcriptional regulator [Budviciaceae bacterium BWR-B9]|uniref:Helix-turn-helix transcriptional regulator n=2 Tax=Budviciaceae TaxID=1903416 RepID=A0ABS1IWJ4_9GAMM|nr:helix-turn-helix transcriptional regulator [Limnobaculum allomyrinae]MBV7693719.1 helix-turn-helix transcriptional regulator [Limnobaculum sp. M2-1]
MSNYQCFPNNSIGDQFSSKLSLLTKRELEIFQCLIKGMSNKEVAKVININTKTVSVHRYNIMYKLGVKNSMEFIRMRNSYYGGDKFYSIISNSSQEL